MSKYLDDSILKSFVNKTLDIWENEASKWIPEETFDLQNDLKREKAKRVWTYIVWSIYIDPSWKSSDYAKFVHDWVPSWQTRNYYKNNWRLNWGSPFVTSPNWTQFMVRAKRKMEDNPIKNV